MKAILTTLFLLFAGITFSQTTSGYTYIDGNGNTYEFNENELKYIPVKPANSSSGTYSGGDPKTVSLSRVDADELKKLFDACIAKKDEQTKENTMGTATIKFKKFKKSMKVMMMANSTAKTALETALVAKKGN